MSTTYGRKRTGIYGAFAVRNPVGKVVGLLVALVLFYGCWEWARYRCGRVGWADKGVYLHTAWDAMVDPALRQVPLLHLGRDEESYDVIVERAPLWPLYTNQSLAAGRPWVRRPTRIDPGLLHRFLGAYVYDGRFANRIWPVWLLWPMLLVACLITGQVVDMRRLRKGRQTGVYLRGNRMIGRDEFNARANEETA